MTFWQWLAVIVAIVVALALWRTSYVIRRNERRAKAKADAEFQRALDRHLRGPQFKKMVGETLAEQEAALLQREDDDLRNVYRPDAICSCHGPYVCAPCQRRYAERKKEKARQLGERYGSDSRNDAPYVDPNLAVAPLLWPDNNSAADAVNASAPEWSGGGGESGGGGASGSWDSPSSDSGSSYDSGSSDSGSPSSD